MKKFKKVASILSVGVFFFGSSFNSVNAKSIDENLPLYEININEEMSKAFNGETDLDIDMSGYFNVSFENNEEEKVNIYFTTTKLTNDKIENNTNFDMYATTILAAPKTSHASKIDTKYHVVPWLTIYWTDYFGPGNKLNSVSGGWNLEAGYSASFSDRTLETRGWDDASHHSIWTTNSPTSNTFSYGASSLLPDASLSYYMFEAKSSVKVNNNSDAVTFSLSTSIFD